LGGAEHDDLAEIIFDAVYNGARFYTKASFWS
jgi:hypothetical protein